MALDEYLKLLDWTRRKIRKDKFGRIPDECASILERLECNAESWLDFVKNFRNEAGLPQNRQHFRLNPPLGTVGQQSGVNRGVPPAAQEFDASI